MRSLKVFNNGVYAGLLTEEDNGYVFEYDDAYFYDPSAPAVSLTISKKYKIHKSNILFPFFANMLSEGDNRALQAGRLKIDAEDDFGILEATAQYDAPGTITVQPYEND